MTDLADLAPIIIAVFLFVVGLGLGACTTVDDFRHAAKKPKAVLIGFSSQYLFMPVASYVLTLIFRLPAEVAIGAVLIGCSPGGTTSNLFSYWSLGDVALSITMSFLSTCAAFGFMPFWIWLLVKVALGSDAEVDWAQLIVTLLLILIPTCVGLAVRRYIKMKLCGKFVYKWVELFATLFGIIFLISSVAVAVVGYGNMFAEMPATAWVTAAIMQPLGGSFGFFVSKFLGLTPKDQRTISLETGIQAFPLTIAIIQLSFQGQDEVLKHALMFPVAYGFLYLAWSPLFVLFFRFYLAPKDPVPKEDPDTTEHEDAKEPVTEEKDLEEPGAEEQFASALTQPLII